MPELKTRLQQPTPTPAQVALPPDFPEIPQEVHDRFPSARDWERRLKEFWSRSNQAIQNAQQLTANTANSRLTYSVESFKIYAKNGIPQPMFSLDGTGIRLGDVLVINTPGRKVYIGEGVYADDGTPFYVDTEGKFSLGASLTWDPDTDTLTIIGIINATSGTIGGFTIGADYIRDVGDGFGLASTVTGATDVRFWAGSTFANRATAPFRIDELGNSYIRNSSTAVITLVGDASSAYGISITGNITNFDVFGIKLQPTLNPDFNGSSLYGVKVFPTIAKGAFTALSAYGFHARLNSSSGAGTIDNAYGLYIDTINVGTNNYGIYSATTAPNYLAGYSGVGVAPSSTTNLILAAGTTGLSSLRLPHGAAPTAPVDGDMWTTAAGGLYVRINGVTVGPLN